MDSVGAEPFPPNVSPEREPVLPEAVVTIKTMALPLAHLDLHFRVSRSEQDDQDSQESCPMSTCTTVEEHSKAFPEKYPLQFEMFLENPKPSGSRPIRPADLLRIFGPDAGHSEAARIGFQNGYQDS